MRTYIDQRAREHGMTRAQWSVLARLERQEGMTQAEMAEALEIQPISLVRLIDRLNLHGLVTVLKRFRVILLIAVRNRSQVIDCAEMSAYQGVVQVGDGLVELLCPEENHAAYQIQATEARGVR